MITSPFESEVNANDFEAFPWVISTEDANSLTVIFLIPQPVLQNTHENLKLSCNWAGNGYTTIFLTSHTAAAPCPVGAHTYIQLLFTFRIKSNLSITFPFNSYWNDTDD